MAKYYIGTAGWSYKDWVPNFYPKMQSANFDWLQFYCRYFNLVEVNSSYYSYTNPSIVETWLKKIEGVEDFLFTYKLHQDFTHKRKFNDKNISDVIQNLDLLNECGRFGGLLVQFPYSFAFDKANLEHIRILLEIFSFYECFIEVRHTSWNKPEVLDLFKNNNIIICTIDQPVIAKSISFDPIVSNNKAYIRLHGRNYKDWFSKTEAKTKEEQNARYLYLYSPGELVEIDQKIKEVEEQAAKIFVILNNHPLANAAANAFEMIHLLEEKAKLLIPYTMLNSFPRLQRIGEDTSDLNLFNG